MRGRKYLVFIITMCFFSSNLTSQITNGLLVNYNFDNNLEDSTPNGFDATAFGTNFTADRFGNINSAIFFDGVTDFVEMANTNVLKPDFPFSISVWINPSTIEDSNSNVSYGIVNTCFVENNYHGAWLVIPNNGNKRMSSGYGDGSGCTGPNCRRSTSSICELREDIWIHVVAIWDSPTLTRIYLNTELQMTVTSGTGDLNIAYTSDPGVLGKTDSNSIPGFLDNHYHGSLDDFYMWDRILTEDEIQELYDFNAKPLIEFDASTDSVTCNVDEVDLQIQAASIYNYTINGAPIDLNSLPKLSGGTYTIVASDGNCTSTQILEVPYDTLVPTLDINIGNITCENPAAQLSASFHPDILSYNWWSVSGSLIAQGEDAEIDEIGNYFLIAVADNGCTETYEFEVTEDIAEPTVSLSTTEITCDSPAIVTASQESSDYIIEWTQFGVFVSDDFSFTTDIEGPYLATVTDTTNGCTTMMSINVIGNVVPITGVDFDLVQECDELEVLFNFNNAIGGVGPFTMTSSAIDIQGDLFFNLGMNNINIVDSQGCSYDSVFVIESLVGINDFNYNLEIDCEKLLSRIVYSFDGGTAPFSVQHSGIEIDGEIYFDAGDHWVSIVDGNQCIFTENFTAETITAVGNLEFTWSGECGDDALLLQGVFDSNNGNFPFFEATSGELFSTGPPFPIKFTAGEHFLTVRSFLGNCLYDTTFFVELIPAIDDVEYSLSQGCETGQAEFVISNIIGGTAPFSIEAITGIQDGDSYFFDSGMHTIMVTDANGCMFEIDIDVDPITALILEDIPDMQIEWPDSVFLNIITNRNDDQIIISSWSGYENLSCTDCISTRLAPDRDVTIIYSVEDIFGCVREQEVFIQVSKSVDIYIPNIFSPNNDGRNDFFNFFPKEDIIASINFFNIYDRWGNLVHNAEKLSDPNAYEGWDGKMNDKEVIPGVYVFIIEAELVNGEIVTRKGDFTLVR